MADWYLYLVRTRQNTIYTGVATDVKRRIREHDAGNASGARYLRGRGPLEIVYQVRIGDQSQALQAEYAVKQLSRRRKDALIAAAPGRRGLLRMLNMAT